eukprot:2672780-Rhodomonas_salina.2
MDVGWQIEVSFGEHVMCYTNDDCQGIEYLEPPFEADDRWRSDKDKKSPRAEWHPNKNERTQNKT